VSPTREQLIFSLHEAAELEHNLMCTYLYAAFSLRREGEGLTAAQATAVEDWRRAIVRVAVEEMAHLVSVWNITSALGGAPRFTRDNFPLGPGTQPASVVVRLAPFDADVVQHFVHLERPACSAEPEGPGFEPEHAYVRGAGGARLTPMAFDYDTVGAFYASIGERLRRFVADHGEGDAFAGDPALQLSSAETELVATRPVICLKTASEAFTAIIEQGEGAPDHSDGSHYARFAAIRAELAALRAEDPAFTPAFPAARNPVLRRPVLPGRVWIEDEEAAATVDLANATYALMLRFLGHAYAVPRPSPAKRLAVDLALSLMRAFSPLAERAARLPAGPSSPGVNAGVSFTALREAGALPPGPSTARWFVERIEQLVTAAAALDRGDARVASARRLLEDALARTRRGFVGASVAMPVVAASPPRSPPPSASPSPSPSPSPRPAPGVPPTPVVTDGVDHIDGEKLTLLYEGKRCIHARFCVTGAPTVFLANVVGPWIHPDAIPVEQLVEIAHACPSGAIRYTRKDGHAGEPTPRVNLVAIRERGPYAVRGDVQLDGAPAPFRATLCRCGASKNKPFCDGSHNEIQFAASGEPPSTPDTDMLPVRDGPLAIDPQLDGPLVVRGNLEITTGTGRVVARLTQAKLCRCGGSDTKPFCDGTHARIGFRSS
jgi:CDGSH-type Zn-finger protein/uncharacterized Fe-S cluster protein YjdI